MPNTFVTLDVPQEANGVGAPTHIGATGHPKTMVLSGAVVGRYVIEGSNDGGRSWDTLVDDNDGTQALFTSQRSGARSVDCVVEQVRVRAFRNLSTTSPPVITLGAPPAFGPNFFASLDVPTVPGTGTPLDLGLGVGPLKTFVCRGNIPPNARITILASMDGVRFDEVAMFTSDQQGTKSYSVMCRYLRVQRSGAEGPPPFVSVGCEATQEPVGSLPSAGGASLTLEQNGFRGNQSGAEEVLYESVPSLSATGVSSLVGELSGIFGFDGASGGRFRVRIGGSLNAPDGTEVVMLDIVPPASPRQFALGPPFTVPTDPTTIVKVTSEGVSTGMRGVVLKFRPASS